jgi:hypothetical protein
MTDRADVLALVDEMIADVDRRISVIAVKAGGYPAVRKDYRQTLDDQLYDFGTSEKTVKVTKYQNAVSRAAVEAFQSAFDLGYVASSGAETQDDPDAQDWLNARVEAELGYIKSMFQDLKSLRDQVWAKEAKVGDVKDFITARIEGYSSSLDGVNNSGRMWGMKNKMLTWNLGATEQHCATCAKLDGNAHKAKWYLARNYIPRQAGSDMECGGYRCDCSLTDQEGETVTL